MSRFVDVDDDVLATAADIHARQLDVLVYPEIGLDPHHQALAALWLAPVQYVLSGHPVGSGLSTIDCFLGGDLVEPAGADAHYRERLIRLPGLGASPSALPDSGSADWLPSAETASPLLLCTQFHPKLVPGFDDVLARIVAETGAQIGFFDRVPPLTRRFRARIDAVFAARELDSSRLLIDLPPQRYADYLAGLAATPLVLDSTWFSGGGTSLDALGVGVPVVTLRGDMARGRQTAAMLDRIGASALIADSDDHYVDIAVRCLRDRDHRDGLAARIRAGASVLFDDPAPIDAFAALLADSAVMIRDDRAGS